MLVVVALLAGCADKATPARSLESALQAQVWVEPDYDAMPAQPAGPAKMERTDDLRLKYKATNRCADCPAEARLVFVTNFQKYPEDKKVDGVTVAGSVEFKFDRGGTIHFPDDVVVKTNNTPYGAVFGVAAIMDPAWRDQNPSKANVTIMVSQRTIKVEAGASPTTGPIPPLPTPDK